MVKLKVADLSIFAEGFENDYFLRRTAEYSDDSSTADMEVSVSGEEFIERPKLPVCAAQGSRYFCETESEYVFYDMYKDSCIAWISASKDWRCVSAKLVDVYDMGGAPDEVRRFNLLGEVFKYRLLEKDGIVYHSSTVLYDDSAVLFTAASGTGKSTHTGLWNKYFGAKIINDDSPAILTREGSMTVFGTPWSGKTELNMNVSALMRALVFLERSEHNFAEKIRTEHSLPQLVYGMMSRPVYKETMVKSLNVIEKIAESVPLYKLGCNISREAAEIIKNKIFV